MGTGHGHPVAHLLALRERPCAVRLAVVAAPETHYGAPAGSGTGQAERGLHRFGTAAVELHARQVGWQQPAQRFQQGDPGLGGERSRGQPPGLGGDRGHLVGMGMADAADADPGHEVQDAVAVRIPEHGTLAALEADLCPLGDALQARRDQRTFTFVQGARAWAGHFGDDVGDGELHDRSYRWQRA